MVLIVMTAVPVGRMFNSGWALCFCPIAGGTFLAGGLCTRASFMCETNSWERPSELIMCRRLIPHPFLVSLIPVISITFPSARYFTGNIIPHTKHRLVFPILVLPIFPPFLPPHSTSHSVLPSYHLPPVFRCFSPCFRFCKYSAVLYCSVLCCAVQCGAVLCCCVLLCGLSCCAALLCVMLCCFVLHCALSGCAARGCVVPLCAGCVVLCSLVLGVLLSTMLIIRLVFYSLCKISAAIFQPYRFTLNPFSLSTLHSPAHSLHLPPSFAAQGAGAPPHVRLRQGRSRPLRQESPHVAQQERQAENPQTAEPAGAGQAAGPVAGHRSSGLAGARGLGALAGNAYHHRNNTERCSENWRVGNETRTAQYTCTRVSCNIWRLVYHTVARR